MNELMFQAGVKGMSERSELIPCIIYTCSHWLLLLFITVVYCEVYSMYLGDGVSVNCCAIMQICIITGIVIIGLVA